jgi:hypothetical protein
MGIQHKEAHTWQTIAKVPEEKFTEFIEQTKSKGRELSTAATYQEAKRVIEPPGKLKGDSPDITFAFIRNAIEEYDSEWLASEECILYFKGLGLPYGMISSWVENGCEPKFVPAHEVYIEALKAKCKKLEEQKKNV